MSIYDPFGFLANITIVAKLLIQSAWKQNIMWDEQLPHPLAKQWKAWWTKFQYVNSLTVPRCYSSMISSAENVQLHIFVDASTDAYAAVAYLRVSQGDMVEVAQVCAKSTCALLKPMTVPRLELQAAVLGCRLKTLIEQNHEIRIDSTTFWSDSQTVILWIRSHSRAYKPFVAHRIVEILSATTAEQWRWIPTALNVADDATRAVPIPEPSINTRWLREPEFLYQQEGQWPRETMLSSVECANEELTGRKLLLCTTVRVVAWVLRFVSNARKEVRKEELQADELTAAEKQICRIMKKVYSESTEE
ncbi:uncharacterized protein LOC118736286 [Rhagoletis pomonella]|uniref:uncharacterized protein LOC118736286 n=1 Tax=Rhagoletis pomonella TaxID=28610 RepID=UPI0017864762|nr:uncharacterized protein LOC118736286 [Rhagoletis pomonella]